MKKIMTFIVATAMSVLAMAQDPVITFERTEHNFGTINEADGRVTTVFNFKNEGMAPLVLSNVRASCGCTTPKWTKAPIEPGQSGEITVTYNPNGRPGRFQKTITVTSNATESTKKLYIKGEVIPKPAKPVNAYTHKIGELSLKQRSFELGQIKKGEQIKKEIEYANLDLDIMTLDLLIPEVAGLDATITLPEVKKGETGKIVVLLDTKLVKQFGPFEAKIYVVINGKNNKSDEFALPVHADIVEDFSTLSIEEKQSAPIIDMSSEINLGKVAAGKAIKGQLNVRNNGLNPLVIRRVYCDESKVKLSHKATVKSGKNSPITITIPTEGEKAGLCKKNLQVITNDPKNPRQRVTVLYTVE